MVVVSATEFRSNFKKYFDMAENETIVIQRSNGTFVLQKKDRLPEPSMTDDLNKAISMEELSEEISKRITKFHKNRP